MAKSKSAYSVAGKKEKLDTHIIVVWVDNEAGVLARVVGLFSGRGYNIESLAVAEIDQKLNNKKFIEKAPSDIINQNISNKAKIENDILSLRSLKETLSD